MTADRIPAPVPDCPRCEVDPHSEPAVPHVHLTDFGYVLFTPNHELRDYIEEIREFERAAGRTAAAADIRVAAENETAAIEGGPDLMHYAAEIAEGKTDA